MLEETLRNALLKAFFAEERPAKELVGGDDAAGELSYKYQCRLAYCLGLIGKATLVDLDRLGRIRNRFAHGTGEISFETDQVTRDRCMSLTTPERLGEYLDQDEKQKHRIYGNGNLPVNRFLATVLLISKLLHREVDNKAENTLSEPQWLQ